MLDLEFAEVAYHRRIEKKEFIHKKNTENIL